jgi:hypothetical protein
MLSQPSSSQTKSESLPSHQEVSRETPKHYIGENLSRKDRTKFLLTTVSIIVCVIIVNEYYFDTLNNDECVLFFVVLIKPLMVQLRDIDDNKEAIYGALDAWVAWEQNFPIGSLRNILLCLEKEQQWHRIVQVCMYHLLFLFLLKHFRCQMKRINKYICKLVNGIEF